MLCDVTRPAIAAVVGIFGCRHGANRVLHFPDAPVQLGDDGDREQAIDALLHRITTAIAEAQPFVAEGLTLQLTSRWQANPRALGRALAGHLAVFEELPATFATSGALEPHAVCALDAECDLTRLHLTLP